MRLSAVEQFRGTLMRIIVMTNRDLAICTALQNARLKRNPANLGCEGEQCSHRIRLQCKLL